MPSIDVGLSEAAVLDVDQQEVSLRDGGLDMLLVDGMPTDGANLDADLDAAQSDGEPKDGQQPDNTGVDLLQGADSGLYDSSMLDLLGADATHDVTFVDTSELWFGTGASELVPRSVRLDFGSAGLGGISKTPSGLSYNPAITCDSLGRVFVAWEDSQNGYYQLYVRQFDGERWTEAGQGSASGLGLGRVLPGGGIALTVDATDRPVLAWNSGGNIYVRRFDGVAWQELGAGSASGEGVSTSLGRVWEPAITVDNAGLPVLAWSDEASGNREICVKRFDGSVWVEASVGSATGACVSNTAGSSREPSLAVDSQNRILVAWGETIGSTYHTYVRMFSGTSWDELGANSASNNGISGDAIYAWAYAAAFDGQDNPWVVWRADDVNLNTHVYGLRFVAGAWQEISTSSASGDGITPVDIEVASEILLTFDTQGRALLAWSGDGDIHVMRYGTDWVNMGSGVGVNATVGVNLGASMTLDPSGNPLTAWNLNGEIYVKRFTDNWQGLGATPVVATGISGDRGRVRTPALALRSDGRPALSWTDESSGNAEIYFMQYDGTNFVELAGSATAGGVSLDTGSSMAPALALNADEQPIIAWRDNTSGYEEIYARAFDGSTFVELGAGSASGAGLSNTRAAAQTPALSLTPAGLVWVAWQDTAANSPDVYALQFDGSAWQELSPDSAARGGLSDTGAVAGSPQLKLDSTGRAILAWTDSSSGLAQIYVKLFDGAAWQELGGLSAQAGGISNSTTGASSPALALTPDGNPMLAWVESAGEVPAIVVARWLGDSWQNLGAVPTAAGTLGVFGAASAPAIASDVLGQPIVAWQQDVMGDGEIMLRRFDGSQWIDFAGSGQAGGVSNSAGQSTSPALAVVGDEICVAWVEATAAGGTVLLRCSVWPPG